MRKAADKNVSWEWSYIPLVPDIWKVEETGSFEYTPPATGKLQTYDGKESPKTIQIRK
jgi:hypothetical protein